MSAVVDPARLEALFRELVGTYSPSGKEEAVLDRLEDFLAEQGCPYGVQPVDEDRYNLLLGRLDAPLLLVGHVDTVPAWDLGEIGPEDLPGGWVRGLGSADMKGGCAALVEAYLTLRADGAAGRVGLALVVGEEEEGDGAKALLRETRPRRALVGEPTGLALCTGHYGYLEVELAARGRRAHASLPERGDNAAEAMLRALQRLLQDSGLRGAEGIVVGVRHLETANPGFAVPERASAWLDVHVPPGVPLGGVKEAVSAIVGQEAGGVEVSFPTAHEGFRLPEGDALVGAFRRAGGRGLDVFRSHSDASLFHAAGVPTAVLGPGRLEYAHAEEERVELAEVIEAARLYVEIARLLGEGG